MKLKIVVPILILFFCGLGIYGLWDVAQAKRLGDKPPLGRDGKLDYAVFLNKKLDGLDELSREDFLYDYLASIDVESLGNLLAQQREIRPHLRTEILTLAGKRAGELAPSIFWTMLVNMDSIPLDAVDGLLQAWGALDFETALRSVDALDNKKDKTRLRRNLLIAHAHRFPEAVAKEVFTGKNEGDASALACEIFQYWGEQDPLSALSFAREQQQEMKLGAFFSEWVIRDPSAALTTLESMEASVREQLVIDIIESGHLMRTDMPLARNLLDRFPTENAKQKTAAYVAFFRECMRVAPEATLAEIGTIPDTSIRLEVMKSTIQQLSRYLPQTAIEQIHAWLPSVPEVARSEFLGNTCWGFSKNAPKELLSIANTYHLTESVFHPLLWNTNVQGLKNMAAILPELTFTDEVNHRNAWRSLAHALYQKDPKAAYALLEKAVDTKSKEAVADVIIDNLATNDLAQAIALYQNLRKKEGLQLEAYSLFSPKMKITDPTGTLRWITENVNTGSQGYVFETVFEAIATAKFDDAIELLPQLPEGGTKDRVVEKLAAMAAKMPPDEAFKWADALDNPIFSKMLTRKITESIASEDFEAGLSLLQRSDVLDDVIQTGVVYSDFGKNFFQTLISEDPDRVREVIDGMPADRQAMIAPIYAEEIEKTSPADALTFLMERSSPKNNNTAFNITDRWAYIDAESTIAWMDTQTFDGTNINSENLYRNALERWMKQSPMAASQWIADQPQGAFRDDMVSVLIRNETANDPEGALAWAYTIGDDKQRDHNVQAVFKKWNKDDPISAQTALEQAPISETLRAEILKNISQ